MKNTGVIRALVHLVTVVMNLWLRPPSHAAIRESIIGGGIWSFGSLCPPKCRDIKRRNTYQLLSKTGILDKYRWCWIICSWIYTNTWSRPWSEDGVLFVNAPLHTLSMYNGSSLCSSYSLDKRDMWGLIWHWQKGPPIFCSFHKCTYWWVNSLQEIISNRTYEVGPQSSSQDDVNFNVFH